jgi:curli biogenesis system outer membrane secretion channel CsgG
MLGPARRIPGLFVLGLLPALLAGCAALVGSYRPLPTGAVPPAVAVSSFENCSGFAGQWELGTGMADLLVSELVKSRNFVVVERGQLGRVVDEIERQRRKWFRSEGRVDEGRLRNARYLIRGQINDFSQVGGNRIGMALRNVAAFGGGGGRARVAITLTIVDVETGEIADSVLCSATAAARAAYASGSYRNVTFGGDAFFKTPLGSATAQAIRRGVGEILKAVPRITWAPMIADVADGRVILNGGKARGFRVGRLYTVRGEGRRVTDPATGELLADIAGPIVGTLRVTDVQRDIAYAEVVRGRDFHRGQRLEPAGDQPAK